MWNINMKLTGTK